MKTIDDADLRIATGGVSAADRTTALSTLTTAIDDLKRSKQQPDTLQQMLPLVMMMRMRG